MNPSDLLRQAGEPKIVPSAGSLSSEKRALLERRLRAAAPPASQKLKQVRRAEPSLFPPSFNQERFWFLWCLEPESSAYNTPLALRLRGNLDVSTLEQAWGEILRRHAVLRATFPVCEGRPMQVIRPWQPATVPLIDLTDLPGATSEKELPRLAQAAARVPFDLLAGPVCRASLFRLGPLEHVLLLVIHHIAFDGWSGRILPNELAQIYEAFGKGQESPLPPLVLDYADYAAWQRQCWYSGLWRADLDYWQKELSGLLPVLDLPIARPRPGTSSGQGMRLSYELDAAQTDALRALCRREQVTPFMALLAAYQTLLFRYGGQEEVIVGCPIAGRTGVSTEPLVGCFINTLALRGTLRTEMSFRDLLAQVREKALAAFQYQGVPFEKVVEAVNPLRTPGTPPVFQVLFNYRNFPARMTSPSELRIEPWDFDRGLAQFDLLLSLVELSEGIRCDWTYDCDLFAGDDMRRLAEGFQVLLCGALADPATCLGKLPLLADQERQRLLVEWNATDCDYPRDKCVHELFEEHAARTPDAVAVVSEDRQLTYRELNERANQLAHNLRSLGVGAEVLVGLCVERSLEMVSGLLGILKAGGAYVPLDPETPPQRLAFMLADSQVRVVLTKMALRDRLAPTGVQVLCLDEETGLVAGQNQADLRSSVGAENLAYVMYTSGSTGVPKGVEISHRAINRLLFGVRYAPLDADLRVGQLATISFDASTFEVWGPLLHGGCCVLFPEGVPDFAELEQGLRRHRIRTLFLTTSLFNAIVDERPRALQGIEELLVGGEALSVPHVRRALSLLGPKTQVTNIYGPTECTTFACCYPIPATLSAESLSVPIGRPISNTRAYVLDGQRQLVPVGVPGELHLGGDGLARGYLDRPELTAERFVASPFEAGTRLYRTGDRVRWRTDGALEFLGRLDDQVKLRGFRIELGEIDAVLGKHPSVQQAVVICQDRADDRRLVGYVVPRPGQAPTSDALREFLGVHLPPYMIPTVYVLLESLPLTPNGKVDRRALPDPDPSRPDLGIGYVPPRDALEEALAAIWVDTLGLQRVGIHHNFFDLGGHSLLATQVIARANSVLDVDLPLRRLFETPTIASLAAQIKVQRAGGSRRAGFRLAPAPRDGLRALPLSFSQRRLWFLDKLEGERVAYNMSFAVRLRGQLHAEFLRRALETILQRHEPLRTIFRLEEGEPIQVVQPPPRFDLPLVDLGALPTDQREAELSAQRRGHAERRFDLSADVMLRAALLRMAAGDHVLLLTLHHVAADGWSIGLLWRELEVAYAAYGRNEAPALDELPIQYADYAAWQRNELQGERLERLLAYWRKQLAGLSALELPTDHPRPPRSSYRGARRDFEIAVALVDPLRRLSRSADTTLHMTLLAAFQVFLARYSGQEDIAVGLPIAARQHVELEPLIGFFVNTLVLRTDLSGAPTFRELLGRVRRVSLEAYDHQDLPFEKLVEELNPARHLSRSPLFQVMFQLLEFAGGEPALPGLEVSPLAGASGRVHFDLEMHLRMRPAGAVGGTVVYSTDLFDPATIDRLVGHFQTLLAGIVAGPDRKIDELPLLTEAERQQLLVEWNDTSHAYPRDALIHRLFEAQVERSPEAVALVDGERRWTYRALNCRANRLANYLRARGVCPDRIVAVCLPRSVELIAALWGVLKAGGAYLPLDPTYLRDADEHLKYVLQDAQVSLVLTSSAFAPALRAAGRSLLVLDGEAAEPIGSESPSNVDAATTADKLAYILYTSGSTGRPKGVMVTHRNLVNAYHGWRQAYRLDTDVRSHLQMASFGFDVFGGDMVRALCSSGKLVICPKERLLEPERLLQLIRREKVDIGEFVPVVLRHLVQYLEDTGQRLDSVRSAIVGSDAWYVADHKRALRCLGPEARLINSYGLTETTIDSCYFDGDASMLPEGALVPIGRPFANVRLYVLDGRMQPAPIGVSGELYIGGDGVARGYVNSGLNAERFLDDTFASGSDARLCRTGDRARRRADGQVEFLGRADNQIKIRGFRIEPGEIEEVLGQHPALAQAAAAPHQRVAGDLRLVAYVVGKPGAVPDAAEMKQFLARRLPEYMIPSVFVILDSLPTTASGKVDRKALPAPDWSNVLAQSAFVAPRPGTEQRLAAIWSEVLKLDRIGAHDNFFELGGHSLLAARVVDRIQKTICKLVSLATIFRAPTIAELARHVESDQEEALDLFEPIRRAGSAPVVLCVGDTLMERLIDLVPPRHPLYWCKLEHVDGKRTRYSKIEDLAAHYCSQIAAAALKGPYILCGYSFGGLVALETARQLYELEKASTRLFLVEPSLPNPSKRSRKPSLASRVVHHLRKLPSVTPGHRTAYLQAKAKAFIQTIQGWTTRWTTQIYCGTRLALGLTVPVSKRWAFVEGQYSLAIGQYVPRPFPGSLVLLMGKKCSADYLEQWATLAQGGFTKHDVPSQDHLDMMMNKQTVAKLADLFRRFLQRS